MVEAHAALRPSGQDVGAESGDGVASVVLEEAGAAVARWIDPVSPEGAAVLVPAFAWTSRRCAPIRGGPER